MHHLMHILSLVLFFSWLFCFCFCLTIYTKSHLVVFLFRSECLVTIKCTRDCSMGTVEDADSSVRQVKFHDFSLRSRKSTTNYCKSDEPNLFQVNYCQVFCHMVPSWLCLMGKSETIFMCPHHFNQQQWPLCHGYECVTAPISSARIHTSRMNLHLAL